MRTGHGLLALSLVVGAGCGFETTTGEAGTTGTFTSAGDGDGMEAGSGGSEAGSADAGDGDSGGDGDGSSSGDGDGSSSGDGDGTSSGDGDGTSSGDGDGTSGDGDGTSGDGDGTSGDGDGTSGDGDGTSGDGDGTSGDGDGTSGDGDGTSSGDGDGTSSGDGDGTSGDGDGTSSGDGDGTSSGDGDGTSGDGDGCVSECFSPGVTRCVNTSLIETCQVNGQGCLEWFEADCTVVQPFGECNDNTPDPFCEACVTQPCTAGETRCVGNVHETCLAGAGGCGDWGNTTDCTGAPGGAAFCDPGAAGGAMCVDPCSAVTDPCVTFGDQRCSPSNAALVEQCGIGTGGCLEWEMLGDCTSATPPGIDDSLALCVEQSPGVPAVCERPIGCLTEQPSVAFEPPQIVLTLDRSGSMFYSSSFYDHDSNAATPNVSRWNGLHVAVTNILSQYQSQIAFGVEQFPTSTSSSCSVSGNVDVPVALNNMSTILSTIPNATASEDGGTPGATAVANTINYLQGLGTPNAKAQIYFSDGQITCSESSNTAATTLSNGFGNGIPTYVVGINANSGTLQSELNQLANAGGFPQGSPAYFDGQNSAALEAAMDQIIGQVVTCELQLSLPPPEPDNIDVQVEGMQYTRILPADCATQDGWHYTDEPACAGMPFTCDRITLCGNACDTFKAMPLPTATVEFFCTSG